MSPKINNIIGQKFNRLLVIEITNKRSSGGQVIWKCRCDCGNLEYANSSSLKSGATKSCGCYFREQLKINSKTKDNINIRDVNIKLNKREIICLENLYLESSTKHLWKCLKCGTEWYAIYNNVINKNTGCYKCSIKCKEKHHFWRGGSSNYPDEWTKKLKEQIRNRDNHKCQYPECNYDDTKQNRKLDVHHIDGNKTNCDPSNLISLCHSHHMIVEKNNIENWNEYFLDYINDLGL